MKNKLYALGLTGLVGLYGCGKDETSVKTEKPVETPKEAPQTPIKTETPKETTNSKACERKHNFQEGAYKGIINGYKSRVNGDSSQFRLETTKFTVQAEYKVYGDDCRLTLYFPKRVVGIYDAGCDNRAEEVTTPDHNFAGNAGLVNMFHRYKREDLDRAWRAHIFDSLLSEGQKLVQPENYVFGDYKKELDDLLQP